MKILKRLLVAIMACLFPLCLALALPFWVCTGKDLIGIVFDKMDDLIYEKKGENG